MAMDEAFIRLSEEKLDSLELINNQVLVEVFDDRGEVNGIKVPITIDNPFIPFKGIVVKVAPSVSCISPGEYVIIEQYKGKRVFVGQRQFILMHKDHVIAKLI